MKRVLLMSVVCALMCACTMSNKNLLSEKIAKYPADKYITKIVSDADKKTAKNTALAELKTLFAVLPPYEGSALRRETILSTAYTAQWWKDKNTGKYYAIAVLEREPAMQVLAPYYQPIDVSLSGLQGKITAEPDKFVRLKNAVLMPPLLKQREELDSEYRLLSFSSSAFDEEKLYSFKTAYNKTFYDIKINTTITGLKDNTVKTYIIDALNSLGFGVGEGLQEYDIDLGIETLNDKYASKTTDGLYWSTATANVTLKDKQTGGVFAAFSQAQRIGASREEEAQRRSLIAAGQACAPVIKVKLLEYIEKK